MKGEIKFISPFIRHPLLVLFIKVVKWLLVYHAGEVRVDSK